MVNQTIIPGCDLSYMISEPTRVDKYLKIAPGCDQSYMNSEPTLVDKLKTNMVLDVTNLT